MVLSNVSVMLGPRTRTTLAAGIYVASIAYAVAELWRFPWWTVDDAYIVFRYARNLVEHAELSWNVGAPPVEGYTGIVLPLAVAAGMKAGVTPEVLTRTLGIAAFFLAAWTVYDNQRVLGIREPTRAYMTALALLFPPLYAHATSGLETLVFAALAGVCLGFLLRAARSPRSAASQALFWMSALALSLVRPEGVLCTLVLGAALAWKVARAGVPKRAPIARAVGFYAAPYGAYFVWRAAHYGRLLPNTYYAKQADSGWDPEFCTTGLALAGAFLPVLLAGLLLTLGRRRVDVPRWLGVVAAVLIALVTLGYSRSTLIMGYLFRFQIHWLFLFLPLVGAWLSDFAALAQLPERCGRARGWLMAAVAIGVLGAEPVELLRQRNGVRALCQRYLDVQREEHARIGAWLRAHLPESEAIACYVDAGMVPFLAGEHRTIDFGRLSDAYLAHLGRTPAEVADYFFSLGPGALIVASDSATRVLPQHGGGVITGDSRFAEYERVLTYCSPEHREAPCEMLFLRRSVAVQ